MKTRIYKFIALGLVLCSVSGCKKYLEDVQKNPNAPDNVSPKALLTNAELSTFINFNGNINRRAAIFTQHLAGATNQAMITANYLVTEGDVTNEWSTLYANAIVSCQTIIEKYDSQSPYYSAIAKILKALNLGLATDAWGDVPCSEAGKGLDGVIYPKYDAQQDILNAIQTMLSEAIIELQMPVTANVNVPAGEDYIFQGNPKRWISIAYVIKARYHNRLSKKTPVQSATDALADLQAAYANGFASSADDANAVFSDKGNENNQWAVFEGTRAGYVLMGKYFIDLMNTNADPRLPFFASKNKNGIYIGAPNDPNAIGKDPFSALGPFYGSTSSKAPMVTFIEAKFIEAECQLRLNNPAGAAMAYNAAVKASILDVTGAPNMTYEAAHASETAGSITLNKIMTEKYVALFTQSETWADWRRTGIPNLTPNPSGAVNEIPRITPTSQDERVNNPNAHPVIISVIDRVWWDK